MNVKMGEELTSKYGVGIIPLRVIMGDKSLRDGLDVTPQDIFRFVAETGVLPKTSAPSREEYAEFFAENLKSADALIHYNISSKASVSYENALAASAQKSTLRSYPTHLTTFTRAADVRSPLSWAPKF